MTSHLTLARNTESMNLAESLFTKRARNLNPESLGDILGRLIWIVDDNGTEITRTLAEWLRGEDREKIAVALSFDEVFLADTPEQLGILFDQVCVRFPEFRAKCDGILLAWAEQTARK